MTATTPARYATAFTVNPPPPLSSTHPAPTPTHTKWQACSASTQPTDRIARCNSGISKSSSTTTSPYRPRTNPLRRQAFPAVTAINQARTRAPPRTPPSRPPIRAHRSAAAACPASTDLAAVLTQQERQHGALEGLFGL